MHEYVLNMSDGQSVKELLLLSVQLNDITDGEVKYLFIERNKRNDVLLPYIIYPFFDDLNTHDITYTVIYKYRKHIYLEIKLIFVVSIVSRKMGI